MAETSEDWNFYEAKYKPLYEELAQTINQLAKPLQLQEKTKKGRYRKHADSASGTDSTPPQHTHTHTQHNTTHTTRHTTRTRTTHTVTLSDINVSRSQ
jgi:hypothetical protein